MSKSKKQKVYSPEEKAKIKKIFLQGIAAGKGKYHSAAAAGIRGSTIEGWKYQDRLFAMDWIAAQGEALTKLEAVVSSRVLEGDLEPVIHQGRQAYTFDEKGELVPFMVRKWDTRLQVIMLQALDPEKYCPNVRAKYFERFVQPIEDADGSENFDETELDDLIKRLEKAARNKARSKDEDEGAAE